MAPSNSKKHHGNVRTMESRDLSSLHEQVNLYAYQGIGSAPGWYFLDDISPLFGIFSMNQTAL